MTKQNFNCSRVRRPTGGRKARQPPPLQVVDAFNRKYQRLWSQVELVRRDPRHYLGLEGWASWSYLPVNVAMGILQSAVPAQVPPEDLDITYSTTAQLFSTFAGWRHDQSVYRLSPEALARALAAPLPDRLPVEAFLRLPEPTVYIETPGLEWFPGMPMVGFFASTDDRGVGGRNHPPELIVVPLIDSRRSDPRLHPSLGKAVLQTQFMRLEGSNARLPETVPITYPLALDQVAFMENERTVRLGKAQALEDLSHLPDLAHLSHSADFLRSVEGRDVSLEVLAKVLRLANVLSYLCTAYELAWQGPPVHTQ